MDEKGNYRVRYGPIGALAPLGEAFAAALDEEIARLQDVATAYCGALREGKRRCSERRRGMQDGKIIQDVDEETQSECSSGMSSGDAGLGSETSRRDDSLIDKWSALEVLLDSLTHRQPLQEITNRGARRKPIRGSKRDILQAQSEIKTLRTRFTVRKLSSFSESVDDAYSPLGVLRRAFDAWHTVCVVGSEKRTRRTQAASHWRRRLLLRMWRTWFQFFFRRRWLQQCSTRLTQTTHHRILDSMLGTWWKIWRRNRASKLLGRVHAKCLLKSAIICWIELRVLSNHIKKMYYRARQRHLGDVLGRWKSFAALCSARRRLGLLGYRSIVRRYFRRLFVNLHAVRWRRKLNIKALQFRCYTQLQYAFKSWGQYVEERRRKHLAVEWWSHYLISSCFEAWVQYRQRLQQRVRLHISAYRFCSLSLMRKTLKSWQAHNDKRRVIRTTLKNLVYRQLIRACLQTMKDEFASYAARIVRLNEWRLRRCICVWSRGTLRSKSLNDAGHRVSATRRRRLLEHFAWSVWRDAFQLSRRLKRLDLIAQRQFTRKWWRFWSNYPAYRKAKQAVMHVITADYERRVQQWAMRRWKEYRTLHAQQRFVLLECEAFHDRQLTLRGLRRLRFRIEQREWNTVAAEFATTFFLRNQWAKFQRGVQLKRRFDQARLETIEANRPTWQKRSCFVTWRSTAQARARCRLTRLFRKWQRFVQIKERDRALMTLHYTIMNRRWFQRWRTYIKSSSHHRECCDHLSYLSKFRLLKEMFSTRWIVKTKRNQRARNLLEGVASRHCLTIGFMRWYRRALRQKIHRQVFHLRQRQCMVKIFKAIHSYTISKPREFVRQRRERNARRIFLRWYHHVKRQQWYIRACLHLQQHRAQRMIHRWILVVDEKRAADANIVTARRTYEQSALLRAMRGWKKYQASIVNIRFALQGLKIRLLDTSMRKWRNAFAQQIILRDLEQRHQLSVLRQVWIHLVCTVQTRKGVRQVWLKRLQLLRLSSVFFRWCQLVSIHREAREASKRLSNRVAQRTCKAALKSWVQFVTVRAFACLRMHEATFRMKSRTLHYWKLFAEVKKRRRFLRQQFQLVVLQAFKKNASICRARRIVRLRRQSRLLHMRWRQWRIEYWIRRCSLLRQHTVARRCLDAWRCLVHQDSSRRERCSVIFDRDSAYVHSAPFVDARRFRETAKRNRQVMKCVLQGWRLLVSYHKRHDAFHDTDKY